MELRQLNTFITIAKLKSFSKAAAELQYAQSSVTSQIQMLEQELNVKLFERLGHSIALTNEGRSLLPIAKEMIKLSKDAKSIGGNLEEPTGTLIIGATESLCVTRLPKLFKEYRMRYPKVELMIKFGSKDEFLNSMKENTLDIAFFVEQKMEENDFIKTMEIPEPMVLLCAPEHPFAKKDKVLPMDLNEEAMILTEPDCGYRILFNAEMSKLHVKPGSIIETGNVQAIKQLTISGMGIAFLPQTAVEEELLQKRLIRLNWMGPEFRIYTQVLHHKTKWMSASLKAFLHLMQEKEF